MIKNGVYKPKGVIHRVCTKCAKDKPLSEFDKINIDNRHSHISLICKTCVALYNRLEIPIAPELKDDIRDNFLPNTF